MGFIAITREKEVRKKVLSNSATKIHVAENWTEMPAPILKERFEKRRGKGKFSSDTSGCTEVKGEKSQQSRERMREKKANRTPDPKRTRGAKKGEGGKGMTLAAGRGVPSENIYRGGGEGNTPHLLARAPQKKNKVKKEILRASGGALGNSLEGKTANFSRKSKRGGDSQLPEGLSAVRKGFR